MPKLGMEPIRREALVKATIAEIGERGSLDVTVSQIARRAGVSAGLAHHYFGSKERILVAAIKFTLEEFADEVRGALARATDARARVEAIVVASFSPRNFRRETVAAWMNFYVLAQSSDTARRLLEVYHGRLRSNLRHGLRPLVGARSKDVAARVAALIDGVYLRQSLGRRGADRARAEEMVLGYLHLELERGET